MEITNLQLQLADKARKNNALVALLAYVAFDKSGSDIFFINKKNYQCFCVEYAGIEFDDESDEEYIKVQVRFKEDE